MSHRIQDRLRLESCPRPATKEAEDAYFLGLFRRVLEECTDILGMPGTPSLADVPAELRSQLDRLRADNAALREALADACENWESWLQYGAQIDQSPLPQVCPDEQATIAEYRKLAGGGE